MRNLVIHFKYIDGIVTNKRKFSELISKSYLKRRTVTPQNNTSDLFNCYFRK